MEGEKCRDLGDGVSVPEPNEDAVGDAELGLRPPKMRERRLSLDGTGARVFADGADDAGVSFGCAPPEDEDCAPTEGWDLVGLEELVLLFERGRVVVVSSGRFRTLEDLEAEMDLGLESSEPLFTLLDSACGS